MSREFGSYMSGYLHDQIQYAADDLAGGRDALTRAWAPFFQEFHEIAYAICSSEACDAGPDYPILETINRIGRLKTILSDIEGHVAVYKRVADTAVREAAKAAGATGK